MFKNIVRVLVIMVLLSFSGVAFAGSEFGVSVIMAGFDFVYADKAPESVRYDLNGNKVNDDYEEYDYLRYYRDRDTVCIINDVGPDSSVVYFSTRETRHSFSNGVKIGGPVSKVLASGVVEGKYTVSEKNGVKLHNWTEGDSFVSIAEKGGKISEIAIFITDPDSLPEGAKINWAMADYLKSTSAAKPSMQSALSAPQPENPADAANTSTDAKVIGTYPLTQGERNTLSIQHRAAYSLYSKKRYKDAYAAFAKLAEQYDCNYLSAYWAGVSAQKLKKNDDARKWFGRALEINPGYKPASGALSKLPKK